MKTTGFKRYIDKNALCLALLVCLTGTAFSADLKPFTSDGCSLFPDGTSKEKAKWCDCCFTHDIAYWKGGTAADREKADDALRDCVLKRTGDKKLAESMRIGVRAGGHPVSVMWYRWGYGWDIGRGYGPLTEAETRQASALLSDYRAKHPGGYCAKTRDNGTPGQSATIGKKAVSGLLVPNDALGDVVGTGAMSRSEIVKKLHAYIKKNSLADKTNNRLINCDEKLGKLFPGKRQFSMFDLAVMIERNAK